MHLRAVALLLVLAAPASAQVSPWSGPIVSFGSPSLLPVGCTDGQVAEWDAPTGTWICGTPAVGTIGGSIAATQVAFGSGVNTIAGDGGFLYGSSTDHLALGTTATLGTNYTLRIEEDFSPAGVLSEVKALAYVRSDYNPSVNQVGVTPILYGYYGDLVTAGAQNIAQIVGQFTNSQHGGTGTLARAKGEFSQVTNTSSGTVTAAYNHEAIVTNTSTGVITTAANFYSGGIANTGGGSIGTAYGLFIEGVAGATTNYAIYSGVGGVRLGDHVALGDSSAAVSPLFVLHVSDDFTATSDGDGPYGVLGEVTLTPPGNQANSYAYGLGGYADKTSNFNIGGVVGVDGGAFTAGGGDVLVISGGQFVATHGGSGTATFARALYAQLINSSTGTVTGGYGLHVDQLTNSGGGTITTAYGIRVEDMTLGATNYSLYTNAGTVRLGGDVQANAHVLGIGSAPTVDDTSGGNSCGSTGNPSMGAKATDIAGKFTVGTGTGTSCTVTFAAAWATAPACFAANETTGNLMRPTSTTTTLVVAGTMVGGDVIAFGCVGQKP